MGAWNEAFTGLHGACRITVVDRAVSWTGRLVFQRSRTFGMALCGGRREEVVTRATGHIRADPRGTYELLVPLPALRGWIRGRLHPDVHR
ncbi:hypothetical protein ACWC9U_39035 [Streptomyces sp. 900116325]